MGGIYENELKPLQAKLDAKTTELLQERTKVADLSRQYNAAKKQIKYLNARCAKAEDELTEMHLLVEELEADRNKARDLRQLDHRAMPDQTYEGDYEAHIASLETRNEELQREVEIEVAFKHQRDDRIKTLEAENKRLRESAKSVDLEVDEDGVIWEVGSNQAPIVTRKID